MFSRVLPSRFALAAACCCVVALGMAGRPLVAAPPDPRDPAVNGLGPDSRLVTPLVSLSLKTSEGTTPIRLVRGEVSSAGFGPFVNTFMNYAGTRSPVRSHDRRPTLLVESSAAPEVGRFFFAKLDSDTHKSVRSLKIAKMVRRSNNPGGRLAPDDDWVLPFEVREESPGTWRVTAARDLEPGEYGFYVNLQADASQGLSPQGGGIFDFGID